MELDEVGLIDVYHSICFFVEQKIFILKDLDVIHTLVKGIKQIGLTSDMLDRLLLDWIRAYVDGGRMIDLPEGTSYMSTL